MTTITDVNNTLSIDVISPPIGLADTEITAIVTDEASDQIPVKIEIQKPTSWLGYALYPVKLAGATLNFAVNVGHQIWQRGPSFFFKRK